MSLSLVHLYVEWELMLLVFRSFYEGHTMELITFATRVCKVLGVETMIGALSEPRLRGSSSDWRKSRTQLVA